MFLYQTYFWSRLEYLTHRQRHKSCFHFVSVVAPIRHRLWIYQMDYIMVDWRSSGRGLNIISVSPRFFRVLKLYQLDLHNYTLSGSILSHVCLCNAEPPYFQKSLFIDGIWNTANNQKHNYRLRLKFNQLDYISNK
jgi:hypothetical protein